MKQIFDKNKITALTLCGVLTLAAVGGIIPKTSETVSAWVACKIAHAQPGKPLATVSFSRQNPASEMPVLTWTKTDGAVAYEFELLSQPFKDPSRSAPSSLRLFSTNRIYVTGYNADLTEIVPGNVVYWRVRALEFDRRPISPFSDTQELYIDHQQTVVQKPVPTSFFNQSQGSSLLYPVYAWIPVAGAKQYEVEILDDLPENPNGIEPSVHRIDTATSSWFDYYDETPRTSDKPLYWRVRGLDANGNPVGVYSDAGAFGLSPATPVTVATYGDSITHGGGGVSYPPSDWEYDYQHYLNFPVVNLAKSGDTSQTMVERFDQDVLPFHPQYLIIMGGTNSLRGGVTADDVIADLQQLKEKCLANNIRPIFLTLPPINPTNIKKVFDQPTAPDWQQQMRLVNDFIRTQVYIDTAREFKSYNGILLPRLAVDGLHLDMEGKRRMAAVINANWPRITKLDWQNENND